MNVIDLTELSVDQQVERLFKVTRRPYGEYCRNPVTGGGYVAGLEPIKPQKEAARRALRAREWFRKHGPADVQPLPLSIYEREPLKLGRGLLNHILAWYARSLEGRKFDVEEHPSFADYVSGVLWEAEQPVGGFAGLPNGPPEELRELKKRFPPRMLKGMSPGLKWLPPRLHAEAIASIRRCSHNGKFYFNRE